MSRNRRGRRRRSILRALAVLAVLALGRAADAQAPRGPEEALERELGFLEAEDVARIPVTVASRGPPIPAGEAPAVVDVITAKEIRASGARTLAELLEQRVGIDVALNRVAPRGLNTAPSQGLPLINHRTLLLIDGRPTNGVFFGEFVAGRELPLSHIARIEIVRGPGSALYGTNAMAGVINVVTKDGADGLAASGLVEGGTDSTRRFELEGGAGDPARNGYVFLHHFGSGGADQINRNDDQRNLYAFLRGTAGAITLEGEALSFSQETPGTEDEPTPADRVNRERYSLGASFRHPVGERFRLAGRAYANLHQTRFLVAASDVDRRKYDESRLGQELSLHYRPAEWLSITLGGEVREENGEVGAFGCVSETAQGLVADPDGCDLSQEVFAGYVEDQITLPWHLTLTAGARYDRVTLTDDGRWSPRVNLLWRPTDATALKVGYGEAFRAPSFFELRGAQRIGATEVVVGNPELSSEVVRAVDGEIAHRFARWLNVRLGGFYMRASDLITQQTQQQLIGIDLDLLGPIFGDPLLEPILRRRYTFINSDEVTVAGLEAAVGGAVALASLGDLSYGLNYTFQDTNNDTLRDTDLPFAPPHKVNLVLDYRPRRDLSIAWRTRWTDRQYSSAFEEDRLSARFEQDVHAILRLTKAVELSVGVWNLFDDDHPEEIGVPREPRTVLAALTVRSVADPPFPDFRAPSARERRQLAEARAAVERARGAGAEELGLHSFREAVAHLERGEDLERRGEEPARVVAAAELARRSAEKALEEARAHVAVRPTPAPVPPIVPLPSPPVEAAPTPRPKPTGPRETRAPTPVRPTPSPPAPPTTTALPVTPTATPTATPTRPSPTPTPTPTPTVDVSNRRVLLLQSDARVAIYRDAVSSLATNLPARIELHDLRGDRDRGREILAEEAPSSDIVVAVGSLAATLARESVADRPILFCAVLNPERYDLAAPNVAGIRFEVSAAAQLGRMRAALPNARRVGVLYDPDKSAGFVAAAERAAARYGMRLVTAVVRDPRDVAVVFRTIREEIDALWLIPDSTVVTRESFEVLALQSAESKVPLVAFAEAFARQGALLALYPDPGAVGAECAALVEQILRGEAEPSEIGIRHPARPRVAVNRRIEEQLGVAIAPGIEPDVEIR